jgi:hypothetical protein
MTTTAPSAKRHLNCEHAIGTGLIMIKSPRSLFSKCGAKIFWATRDTRYQDIIVFVLRKSTVAPRRR